MARFERRYWTDSGLSEHEADPTEFLNICEYAEFRRGRDVVASVGVDECAVVAGCQPGEVGVVDGKRDEAAERFCDI
ncbi:hypothetical protein GCM10009676_08930 [Prauserella halophila]|uniref:Uncharacterized protein n=1 Tax=Prauserella halophila TaxID=185641 RepID=A0ABP4GL75_9PSEU|nr:hypothetical protein [Prauserella halophila]